MFDKIYKIITKNNFLNYFLLWVVFTTIFVIEKGYSGIGEIISTFAIMAFILSFGLLFDIFFEFIILKIVKVNVKFLKLHKQRVGLVVAFYIIGRLIMLPILRYNMAVKIIGTTLGILEFLCYIKIISKNYEMSRKQMGLFIVIDSICRILLMLI